MEDEDRVEGQSSEELAELHRRVTELEESETEWKRAQEALLTREERLRTLSEISQALSSALELGVLLETAREQVGRLFDTTSFYIAVYDQEAGEWDVALEYDRGERMPSERRKVGEGLTGHIIRTGEPVFLRTLQENIAFDEKMGIPLVGDQALCWMGVPLVAAGNPVGVMAVQSYEKENLYDEHDLALFSTIAAQIAIAIDNARLFEETQQALEALRINEERFALAVEGSNDGIWDWDIVSGTLYWSPRFKELLGYAVDELEAVFETFESQLHPDDRERIQAAIDAHLNDGAPYDVEERLCTKSGEYRWFRARGQALWDETGKPLRMTGSISDITEQKQAEVEREELLSRMENLATEQAVLNELGQTLTTRLSVEEVLDEAYRGASQLLDTTSFYIALYDSEKDEVTFALDVTEGELRKPYTTRQAGEGLTENIVRTRQPLLFHSVEEIETFHVARGVAAIGRTALSWLGVPLIVSDRVVGVMAVQSYTTPGLYTKHDQNTLTAIASQAAIAIDNARLFEETRKTMEALRVSEERFALAVQGSNDGIWDWDIANGTLYWSPRMKELLGYTDEEFEVDFDVFNALLHPDDRERTGAAIETYFEEKGLYDVEQRLRAKSGEYRWFRARGRALWDEAGNPVRMVGSTADITEQKAAEDALQKAYAEVEKQVEKRTAELRRETAERERLQQEVIESQKRAIQALSTPLVPVTEQILVLPLVGAIDSLRAKQILDVLLRGVAGRRARVVIMDITGVPVVDTRVANYLLQATQAVRLLGAECILVGITPEVAQTVVGLGVELRQLTTRSDLQGGVEYALRLLGKDIVDRHAHH
jgi:PAS domain S-box-containing protein